MRASLKRQYSGIERELVRALTDACETAKSEIAGFEWLTHRVNYDAFAESLVVTWVFASDASMNAAVGGPAAARIHELTLVAFDSIGIVISKGASPVEFDSQQRCDAVHGGDWDARLNSRQRTGGGHGQRH